MCITVSIQPFPISAKNRIWKESAAKACLLESDSQPQYNTVQGPATTYFNTPPRAEDRVLSALCAADRTKSEVGGAAAVAPIFVAAVVK